MAVFELYFSDLKAPAKRELLKAAGVSGPDEMNWTTIPVTVIEYDERQDEDEL